MRRLWVALATVVVLSAGLTVEPRSAQATVTTSTSSVTYSPGSPTTVFSVTYPFIAADHLVVTKIVIATSAETTLTRGVDYSVTLPIGSTNGFVTTTASVTSTHRIRIDRVVPYTQTTSFRTQGAFLPKSHEDAFDKLTMEIQQLRAAAGVDGTTAVATHVALANPHPQYTLLAGLAGGQHIKGGTAASENLQLSSTANATKGKVLIGSGGTELVVDDFNNRVGILTATPSVPLDVVGAAKVSTSVTSPIIYGSSSASGELLLDSTSSATKGLIRFGSSSTYDDSVDSLGIGNNAPSHNIEVIGTGYISTGLATPILRNGEVGNPGVTLAIHSTEDATKGKITLGSAGTELVVDDVNNRVGVGTAAPTVAFDVVGAGQFTGAITGLRKNIAVGASYTLTFATECGAWATTATDNGILFLPDITGASLGCEITVTNTAAAGTALVSISPHATDTIFGTCGAVVASGTADKDLQNTKATAKKGDRATLISDGVSGWYVNECGGTWAWQP